MPRVFFIYFFYFNVYLKKYELDFPSILPPKVTSEVVLVSGVCVCVFQASRPIILNIRDVSIAGVTSQRDSMRVDATLADSENSLPS